MKLSFDAQEAFGGPASSISSPVLEDFFARLDAVNAIEREERERERERESEREKDHRQVAAMQQLGHHYFSYQEKMSEDNLAQACRAVIDWHIDKIKAPNSLSSEYLVTNLQRALINIGYHVGHIGISKHDVFTLRDALTERTLARIGRADGGCYIEMVLNEYDCALRHLDLKRDYSTSVALVAATNERTQKALEGLDEQSAYYDMWKAWAPVLEEKLMRYQKPPPEETPTAVTFPATAPALTLAN